MATLNVFLKYSTAYVWVHEIVAVRLATLLETFELWERFQNILVSKTWYTQKKILKKCFEMLGDKVAHAAVKFFYCIIFNSKMNYND